MNRSNKDIFNIIYRLLFCGQIKQNNIEYHNKFEVIVNFLFGHKLDAIRVKNSSFGLCFNYRLIIYQNWNFRDIYHWSINLISPQMTQLSYKLPKNY